MSRGLPICLCAILSAGIAFAQARPGSPAFTAAHVHSSPRRADNELGGGILRGERYEIRNATMLDLVLLAYGLDEDKLIGRPLWLTASLTSKVAGGPDWLNFDRFDVVARAPRGTSREDLRLMLQSLLVERFQLAVHRDKRLAQGYVLKAGAKPLLKKSLGDSSTGCQYQGIPQSSAPGAEYDRSMNCHNTTMADLAAQLPGIASDYIANTLTDMTGLEGAWDFVLRWTPRGQPGAADASTISLFDALDKQLGLKVEMQKLSMDVMVVDRVNEKPADNPPGTAEKIPSPPSKFEVTDVRPAPPDSRNRGFGIQPGGRFEAHGATLGMLVRFAWDVTPDMLAGIPKWFETAQFDIVAKAPADAFPAGSIDYAALRPLLRTLLGDRFKLVTHNEDQPVSVYAMSIARRSSNLHKADLANNPNCKSTPPPPGTPVDSPLTAGWTCQNTSMALLADKLQAMAPAYVNHMIVDSTGLAGTWDFTLRWSPIGVLQQMNNKAGADPSGALSVFDALDRQLGIKLELKKQTMPVLVIDSVEQTPTDN